ncbi:hypothetical protein APHAL10511_006552 [Amanita phalloides]|nr:hypothetical protein APHAL10511_006552 [Amanita phalloides]
MRALCTLVSAFFVAAVSAHFQLQFPPPRGPFVENSEPTFCDGYTNITANRTQFPLSGGFFSLNSEHPKWTAGVFIAANNSANSFGNFVEIKPFFQQSGEGIYCFPLLFNSANATGLTNGQNVSIQIVYDGGDGELYQCADLTLSNSVTLAPSDDKCGNATGTNSTVPTGGSASTTSTGSSATPTGSKNSAGRSVEFGLFTVALGLAGLAMSMGF